MTTPQEPPRWPLWPAVVVYLGLIGLLLWWILKGAA